MDLTKETLEWKRFDLSQRFVHVLRAGQNLEHVKNPSYRGRTSLFTDELKRGNISLKLSKVQLSDRGIYHCDLPLMGKQSSVKLVVASGAVSPPVISLAGIDRERGGVILNCESKSWYPEPEVLWLDGEGKLLSAGPTETVRGPDDLYTVSSRVTVEKRHSNSFTCRVQQRNINQTRETHIQVPDDFFKVQSSSSSIITGLAVSLAAVCILLLLFLSFFAWKWRQMKIKTERRHRDETEEEGRRNHSETNRTEDQLATEEEMNALKGKEEKMSKHSKWQPVSRQMFQEEQQRREEAENKVQILEEELQTKTAELQDEHTRREEAERQVQRKQQELQKKTQENNNCLIS
ncbi:CD276 antigen homolog [Epinephelus lanceolatus]